ncbi:MAG TPA: hypothetical protein VKM72_32540 [Thermoanaerobaculia bacterium]|nr:hypothetical protein [Thermoanaerobaculia bacterium]
MSDERLRYIEVIGQGPDAAGEGREEAQRAAFQAARRSAETLAVEADLRITGVQQIAELHEEGEAGGPERVRYRVRFGIEPAKSASSRAGFYTSE